MENVRSELLEILTGMHQDVDFETCDHLIDGKILDSFDIVTLIAAINDEFEVAITADKIIPQNFNSVDALCKMVCGLLEED